MNTSQHNKDIVISGLGPLCSELHHLEDMDNLQREFISCPEAVNSDWFNPQQYLGRRGYKYLTTANRYLLSAVSLALTDSGYVAGAFSSEECGVMIGSNFATSSVLRGLDDTIRTEGADALNPMRTADFCINIPTSYVSMKHGFKAFNLTFTNPLVAGLEAVLLARNALIRERGKFILAGAMEDTAPQALCESWGVPETAGGACVVTLETRESVLKRNGKIYTSITDASMHFLAPHLSGDKPTLLALRDALRKDLIRMCNQNNTGIVLSALDYSSLLNEAVISLVKGILEELGCPVTTSAPLGNQGNYGSVSPVLMLVHTAVCYKSGIVLAISPHGQIVMLNLKM